MGCLLFVPSRVRNRSDYNSSKQTGFTLLELLVVIGLLGVVASVTLLSYEGVQDDGRHDVTEFEMMELRKALLMFRRDTGELPCRVYREGDFALVDDSLMVQLDFTNLPTIPTVSDYHQWCANQHLGQVDWAMSFLQRFPFNELDTAYTPYLWNPDTKRGWNGPYVNTQGLVDGWGNRFLLFDPELDYPSHYRCKEDSGDYDTTDDVYTCLTADSPSWDATTFTKFADIARVVSFGANGNYEGTNVSDPCLPASGSDDLVLCLLR
jgi:prepilin-type N-terminal cleavage/methylation domain-containing protein